MLALVRSPHHPKVPKYAYSPHAYDSPLQPCVLHLKKKQ